MSASGGMRNLMVKFQMTSRALTIINGKRKAGSVSADATALD